MIRNGGIALSGKADRNDTEHSNTNWPVPTALQMSERIQVPQMNTPVTPKGTSVPVFCTSVYTHLPKAKVQGVL